MYPDTRGQRGPDNGGSTILLMSLRLCFSVFYSLQIELDSFSIAVVLSGRVTHIQGLQSSLSEVLITGPSPASSRSASDQWLFINIIICIYTCTAKFACILWYTNQLGDRSCRWNQLASR